MEDFESIGCADCPELMFSPGGARCTLRDVVLGSLSRTFCANHPECGGPPVAVPVGPIVMQSEDGPEVVRDAPDSMRIRNQLLTMVEDSGAVAVEELTPRECVALWQLERWRERRATVLLEGIGGEPKLPWVHPDSHEEQDARWVRPVKSLAGRTRVVVALMALNILLALVAIGSDVMQLGLLGRAQTIGVTVEDADRNDARQTAIARLQLMALLVTAIPFWTWQYRAYANLRSLGAPRVRHSPEFAVVAWFIPVVGLVYPCKVMLEIGEKSVGGESRSMRGRIVLWWLAYLAMQGVVPLANAWIDAESGIEGLRQATGAGIVSELFTILSAGLAIVIVREVRRRQGRRADIVPVFD